MEKINKSGWEELIDDGYKAHRGGRLHDAELLYKAAIAAAKVHWTVAYFSLAKALLLLADLYYEQRKWLQAEFFYRDALSIYDKIAFVDEIETRIILRKLSDVCRAQGKSEDAEASRETANLLLSAKQLQLESLLENSISPL